MKILVLNCGSSSVKYKLFDADDERLLAQGLVEKVGSATAIFGHDPIGSEKLKENRNIPDHETAIRMILEALVHRHGAVVPQGLVPVDAGIEHRRIGKCAPQGVVHRGHGVIAGLAEIDAVGHRVVHGAEAFKESVLIDDRVKAQLRKCCDIAPLHNPANLIGIEIIEKLLPGVPNVGVFDTAFHATLPRRAFLYGLPHDLYDTHGIRKYGFHGTSHHFIARKAAELDGRPFERLRIITVHLGNGSSITAVRNGCSIDTSMGYTPLEGLIMGSRSGDIDPALIQVIMQKENIDIDGAITLLNKKSGLLGLSGVSNDVREILEAAKAGNELARDAIDAFCYRVKKYIGSYLAALNGADLIVFTAGIGENSPTLRAEILEGMENLGIVLDPLANAKNATLISTGSVRVMVVPTNEELEITRDTERVLQAAASARGFAPSPTQGSRTLENPDLS